MARVQSHGQVRTDRDPAKLSAERRDQVCMQCHLEGDAAIQRPGKHLYQYRPGDDLSDYIRYYVLTDSGKPGLRAASQFEALAQSACKKKSGDAMSCTSCHDPHRAVTPEDRVAFYRAKCLTCHSAANLERNHHRDQPDCTRCHMPACFEQRHRPHRRYRSPHPAPADIGRSWRMRHRRLYLSW